jgi:type I restriction-modification system DNA methylase subunit
MNHQAPSSFIWSVADLLRGDYKQSEYGKVILPFTTQTDRAITLLNERHSALIPAAVTDKIRVTDIFERDHL